MPIRIVADATTPEKCARALAGADIYATCTRNESPGLAQAEAMAVGLPAVALDSNGNRDYYDGSNFLMAQNPDDFCNQLVSCFDFGVRSDLANTARQSMQACSVEAAAARLLDYAGPSTVYDSKRWSSSFFNPFENAAFPSLG